MNFSLTLVFFSGLGYATSFLLASRGCRVIIADQNNSDKTVEEIKKITGNQQIIYKHLDLSSLKSTREFAKELKKTETKIDILINNAGIGNSNKLKTNDDLNTVMHINYFGAFLLTHLLLGEFFHQCLKDLLSPYNLRLHSKLKYYRHKSLSYSRFQIC